MRFPSTVPAQLAALAVTACSLAAPVSSAEAAADRPFLHPLFTDNMVLQRGIRAPVWGWTDPGREVKVSMAGKSATAVADADGKWMARLGPFKAGGPHTLSVSGPTTATVQNVLVGDVWICSGQSNMEQGIGAAKNPQEEIAAANYPQIRLFMVPNRIALEPQNLVSAQWQVCSPETVAAGGWGGFSAVGYFFGRQLHQDVKVPIGLIDSNWGGTIAEAWTSAEGLKKVPDFAPALDQLAQTAADLRKGAGAFEQRMREWYAKGDPGSAAEPGWADPALDASAWKSMKLPVLWEQAGLPDYDGIVWFRKEVEIPEAWAGKELKLSLGPIDDRDTTWFNGTRVGGMNEHNVPRTYAIPGALVKAGRAVVAVRVLDTGGAGGIYGTPDQLKLELPGDAAAPLSLADDWTYNASAPLAKMAPVPQRVENNPNVVTVLYNGMIAPLAPFGIKGAIWYQGESNCGRAKQYQTLLPTMIADWRAHFGVGDFPFLIVQLANFMATQPQPGESAWAELREAQQLTALKTPRTGMAVIIDIGEAADIHPKNKQDVGKRLALAARAIAYGEKIEHSGPEYRSMKVEGNRVRLRFSHVGGGLLARDGGKLQGFAIAGADKRFVWADAVIDGETIVVSSPQVAKPVAVRYAWADNPMCNLVNGAGLPASPFRTDRASKPKSKK